MAELKGRQRKIFLKNEKYECSGIVVVCTETTCSYSNENFKAVYISDTGIYQRGVKLYYFVGQEMKCPCANYELYTEEIKL